MGTKKDAYDAEYKRNHYDQFTFRTRIGKKAEYQQFADCLGVSLTDMLRQSVDTFIAERSLQDLPVKPASMDKQPAEKLTSTEKNLLDAFNQLPTDAQKSLIRFLRSVNPHNDAKEQTTLPVDAPN